jgi:signal transduction histidine kinase
MGVAAVTLIAFTLIVYGLLSAAGGNQQDRELSGRVEQSLQALAAARPEDLRPRRDPAPVDPSRSIDMFVLLLDASGAAIASGGEVAGAPPAVPAEVLARSDAEGSATATIGAAQAKLRLHVRPWSRPDLGLGGYVAAAQSTRRVEQELSNGTAFIIVAAAFALLIAGGAIWLVLGRALRPLKQLVALTDEVGRTQDLSRRLPVPGARDDVRRLSESFNEMMARLDEAYRRLALALESQQRFVADASHELRTPLTSIRSNTGFLVQHPDARAPDREAALRDIAGESERMSRLVNDLLTLARADAGQRLESRPFDLQATVLDVSRLDRKI